MPPRLQQTVFESENRVSRETKNDLLKCTTKDSSQEEKPGVEYKDIECKLEDLKKTFIENIGKRKNK